MSNIETSDLWDFYKNDLNAIKNSLLMNTPTTVFLIWILYIIFVQKLGPKFMKNRPAYKLTSVMTMYNALQVILSAYIVFLGVPILWKHGLIPKCMDNTNDSVGYLRVNHHYYMFKIIELLDTVFFILRKKYNQATFLHIYHHSYMVLSTWFIVRYDPTYAVLFPGVLNSFVHVVMYTYYALSAFPALADYLWWKKYITSMQLIQFVIVIWHFLRSYYSSRCPPSFLTTYSMVANCSIFIILFLNFYIKAYSSKKFTKNAVLNCVGENGEIINEQLNSNVYNDVKQK